MQNAANQQMKVKNKWKVNEPLSKIDYKSQRSKLDAETKPFFPVVL